jgi:signal transduction histidine kinase
MSDEVLAAAKRRERGVAASFFAQVLALVLLSVVASQAINLLILFNSPTSPPDFYLISEAVTALTTPGPVTTKDGRPLIRQVQRNASEPRQGESRYEKFMAEEIALRLRVPAADVRLQTTLDVHSPARQTVGVVRRLMGARGFHHGESHFIVGSFEAGVRQRDGRWLTIQPQSHGMLTPWQQRIAMWFCITSLALAPLAFLFARRLSSPISAFARAAERLGRDPTAPPLKLDGPAELRTAIVAFNEMQERLRRYVQDRTAMIGAVAHDLRTPLTRLRFRVEGAPDPLRAKMTGDMEQMDAMIAATMAFVRDATKTGERCRLELSSLVQSVADEMAETGHDVTAEASGQVVIDGDPIALRRLVTNLLDNAIKFGDRARARVYTEDHAAVIEVDDDGPGLHGADPERVFEPFFRGEPSRSRETGGAGLGLAVVRSVARAHGGDAVLENLPDGGLRATARLPL